MFPAVFFLLPLVLSAVIAAAFGAPRLGGEFFVLIAISQTLLLGTVYFSATGLPGQARTGASLLQHARYGFFGLLWGSSMPGLVFLAQAIPSRFEDLDRNRIIVGILLAVATIAGWFRAGVLVRERASRPGIETRKRDHRSSVRNAQDWKRFGALPYLGLRVASIALAMMFGILLFTALLLGNFFRSDLGGNSLGNAHVGMFVVFASFATALQLLNQLRTLRAMPIKTSTLTHWLLFCPLALAICLWLMAQTVFTLLDGSPIHWQNLLATVLGVAFVGLCVPFSLRYGLRSFVVVVMIAVGTSVMISSQFGRISGNHWAWLLVGICVFLAAEWWATYRLLGSPHPWRAGALKWQGMGRRM